MEETRPAEAGIGRSGSIGAIFPLAGKAFRCPEYGQCDALRLASPRLFPVLPVYSSQCVVGYQTVSVGAVASQM